MLTVTAKATEKLQEVLQKRTGNLEEAMRLIFSSENPKQLQFVLDSEKEVDQVVESEEGRKVLLIEPRLSTALVGMVIDYEEKPQDEGFTIKKVSSGG